MLILIKNLGARLNKNDTTISYGEFLCPNTECNKLVEMSLSAGKICKSCGCVRYKLMLQTKKENKTDLKHGYSYTRLYNIWQHIKQRILNSNNHAFKDYGDRGITICDEWLNFIPFRDWSLSHGYADNLTIDRKENNGNYEPSNCQWVPQKENSRKTRRVKLTLKLINEIKYLHKTGNYTQKELAEKYGVSESTISLIINNKRWDKY